MNILMLAPHPFYQDRGTPIAVDRLLKVLSERGDRIDVVTYHEGHDVEYDRVTIHRIASIPFIRHIRPGFSWKKIISDLLVGLKVLSLLVKKNYQLIHAVEESVFLAAALNVCFNIPYVYDMDSSLSRQLVDKYPIIAPLERFLRLFERWAVKHAIAVVPVCEALAEDIQRYAPNKVAVLQDVSLLDHPNQGPREDLRTTLRISGLLLMYVGNLERYQGIDLLLESFALATQEAPFADLVIIGGEVPDITRYQHLAGELGIHHRVHFLGPRPVAHLGAYLSQADILVSPRLQGQNTPMKLYSYLHSGKALLATDLPTHTQILTGRVAMLAAASPEAFAKAMRYLMEDRRFRLELGQAGRQLIEERFSSTAFRHKVCDLFAWLQAEIGSETASTRPSSSRSSRVLF